MRSIKKSSFDILPLEELPFADVRTEAFLTVDARSFPPDVRIARLVLPPAPEDGSRMIADELPLWSKVAYELCELDSSSLFI